MSNFVLYPNTAEVRILARTEEHVAALGVAVSRAYKGCSSRGIVQTVDYASIFSVNHHNSVPARDRKREIKRGSEVSYFRTR